MGRNRQSSIMVILVSIALTITVLASSAAAVGPGMRMSQSPPHFFNPTRVTLRNKTFIPGELTVKSGEPVYICNDDNFFHSLFSYSKHNQFGKPKGLRIRRGECTSRVVVNPTNANLTVSIRDELHSNEELRLTVLPKEGVTGDWKIVQTGASGARYTGTLRLQLQQNGSSLLGIAEWDNHTRGSITGEVQGSAIKLSIEYGDGLIGSYQGELSGEGSQIVNGEARSNKGGGVVKWQASKVSSEVDRENPANTSVEPLGKRW